ncbi:MAG: F0F1 ATP synthase subunit delta [Sulfurimonas sp.]|jgi:F-type H+-transporting ATPase subunit delta|nr:F0F1 ATP synthase subunit delta [Sulfurimonadaceae bacterium]
MEELIAKRYAKALTQLVDKESLTNTLEIFKNLSDMFSDKAFLNIIKNPSISKKDKESLLLESVKKANSSAIENVIKLLVEKNRVEIIPAIAEVLRKEIVHSTKNYNGYVYSDSDISQNVLNNLASGLSKKFDSNISLELIKNDFDGVKVDVDDLGVEINFSKTRIDAQLIEHVLKAI